jgi:multimeric flavodoxin WrbA
MSKKVVVLLGSPRKKGNSAALAEQISAGAESAGADVTSFYLHEMDIGPCRACEGCQRSGAEGCVVQDDMQQIYPHLRAADAIVIASPIYWFTVSAQTKLMMDRWYALQGQAGNVLKGKQFAIALSYGDSDPFDSGAVNALRTFQDGIRYIGGEIVGAVYGTGSGAGEIRSNEDLMDRAYALGQRLGAEL